MNRMAQKAQFEKARKTTGGTSGRGATVQAMEGHLEVLQRCAQTCSETLSYCLEQGGDHAEADHVLALVDCAEVCNFTANFVARDSELTASLLEACADACKRCEESCEEFGDDETMENCANACRECYDACTNA